VSITYIERKEIALLDPKYVNPGQEQYEMFNLPGRMGEPGPERCQFDYRNLDEELFFLRAESLSQPGKNATRQNRPSQVFGSGGKCLGRQVTAGSSGFEIGGKPLHIIKGKVGKFFDSFHRQLFSQSILDDFKLAFQPSFLFAFLQSLLYAPFCLSASSLRTISLYSD
jgi:hypothetical protein